MRNRTRTEAQVNEAWIGDAVLALQARLRILEEGGRINAARAACMTSNQFLSTAGEPTAVEAAIGRAYLRNGLEAAFTLIDEWLGPILARQDARQARQTGKKPQKPA